MKVHIGAREGQVVIRAQLDDITLEAIPCEVFANDLPFHFKNAYIHWLNLKTRTIEFRPLHSPWQTSATNWVLHLSSENQCFMQHSQDKLLNTSSRAHGFLVDSLSSIETEEYIHVQYTEDCKIKVFLPRYKLHFFLDASGKVFSPQLNAEVDPDQTLGTLIGLKTKLILLERLAQNQERQRYVLIPFGDVEICGSGQHTEVFIRNQDEIDVIRHSRFKVNEVLGRLEEPTDLRSALFKTFLHAVTSGELPDPFLGRTGTEEALKTIKKCSMFHDTPLDQDVIKLLDQIRALSPQRQNCELVGQQVLWDDQLTQLAQHEGFCSAANAIRQFSLQLAVFHSNDSQSNESHEVCPRRLHLRAGLRNATFYTPDAFDSAPSEDHDELYQICDEQSDGDQADCVYQTARLIQTWPSSVNVELDLMNLPEIKSKVAGFDSEFCRKRYEELLSIDISEEWGSLYNLLRQSTPTSRYRLMFLFGMVALGKAHEWDFKAKLIRTLLAFAFSNDFAHLDPPRDIGTYSTLYGWPPDEVSLGTTIWDACDEKKLRAPSTVPQRSRAKWEREHQIEARRFEDDLRHEIKTVQNILMHQWPSPLPELPNTVILTKVNREKLLEKCRQLWDHWHKNAQLAEHLRQVEELLKKMHCDQVAGFQKPHHLSGTQYSKPIPASTAMPCLKDLLDIVDPLAIQINIQPRFHLKDEGDQDRRPRDYSHLEKIVAHFRSSSRRVYQMYGDSLKGSLAALRRGRRLRPQDMDDFADTDFIRLAIRMQDQLDQLLADIRSELAEKTPQFEILRQAGNWPYMGVQAFLELLPSSKFVTISEDWKQIILAVGEAVILLQRAKRQAKLASTGDIEKLVKELGNRPRTGWESYKYPDWVLLEIENDFTIREEQARVAIEMMHPTGSRNSVLQLNMGEGKTSVIIPMIAAAIANQHILPQIVVLKPLLKQSQQILRRSLGGFIGRKIYHLPFSRRIPLNNSILHSYREILEQCLQDKGVLLALPEEILSFQLRARDMVVSKDPNLAAQILEILNWKQKHCRIIIDESDEVFDTKSQLLYTVGSHRLVDGSPDRWLVQQSLLSHVKTLLEALKERYPTSMEVVWTGTAFPMVSFFSQEPAVELREILATDIVEDHIPGIHLNLFGEYVKTAIRSYILQEHPSRDHQQMVKDYCQSVQLNIVLTLRGLIAQGILIHVLQAKRWSVEYGLDSDRGKHMAVPYRAKLKPSPNSEFGHADVAIAFTIISFLHAGLSIAQIQACLKSSHAAEEYSSWLEASEMSTQLLERYPTLESINLDDEECCHSLHEGLRHNEAIVNFYLKTFIFPREGGYFPSKLCASGWDIVSTKEDNPTTGFSGTNDNQFLLPFTVKQNDLPEMRYTNAAVLEKLVQPENQTCVCFQNSAGRTLRNPELLVLLSEQTPPIRALIDVGAQILEMSNEEVARTWLQIVDAEAALFYDEDDTPMIIDRQNMKESLALSPFQDRLGSCLLYIDEAHTRGIDLVIPHKIRAAVTLGPRLTKDRLVQGSSPHLHAISELGSFTNTVRVHAYEAIGHRSFSCILFTSTGRQEHPAHFA